MNYNTINYLRDSFWLIDFSISFLEKLKQNLKKFFDKAIEFEYDEYTFRIAENLPYAILILFLGFFATLTLAKYSEAGNGVLVSAITTSSMSPAIKPGSLIISAPSISYERGDIITYKEVNPKTNLETGRAITHRIIFYDPKEEIYIAKGDANSQPDPIIIKKIKSWGRFYLSYHFLGILK